VPGGSRRYPVSAAVVRHDGGAGEWQSVDLSLGGAFLAGGPVLECGTELHLGFSLPSIGEDTEIVARARVRWCNALSQPKKSSYPAGMGVEFVAMEADQRRTLSDYLAQDDSGAAPLDSMVIPDVSDIILTPGSEPTDTPETHELIGRRIGPYQVRELLRTGRMADLFIAKHVQLNRRVALKRLNPRFAADSSVVRRFFDEARLVSQIRHPNIVAITDFLSEEEIHYYVMELVEGESLAERIRRDGPLCVERVVNVGVQLCGALHAAHEAGVVHRNLELDHVMLTQHAARADCVKLLGFGLAKLLEPGAGADAGRTVVSFDFGTPRYLAPEQLLGGEVDARADIYAVGVVLHELATGRPWLTGTSWHEVLVQQAELGAPGFKTEEAAGLPAAFRDLVTRCVEHDPERRPKSAAGLNDELRRIQVRLSGTAKQPWMPQAGARSTRRLGGRAWLLSLLVGLVALAAAGVAFVTGYLPASRSQPSATAQSSVAQERAAQPAVAAEASAPAATPQVTEAGRSEVPALRGRIPGLPKLDVADPQPKANNPPRKPKKSKKTRVRRPAAPQPAAAPSQQPLGGGGFFDQFENQDNDNHDE
jgi:serine/threonine-protein kinase